MAMIVTNGVLKRVRRANFRLLIGGWTRRGWWKFTSAVRGRAGVQARAKLLFAAARLKQEAGGTFFFQIDSHRQCQNDRRGVVHDLKKTRSLLNSC
jgi:hypothetical protein